MSKEMTNAEEEGQRERGEVPEKPIDINCSWSDMVLCVPKLSVDGGAERK
jgi:hypothetical protein